MSKKPAAAGRADVSRGATSRPRSAPLVTAIVLDANVLVSFFTDRDGEQQRIARTWFDAAAAGRLEIFVPQNVIVEFVYVMNGLYAVDSGQVAAFLDDLLAFPGVRDVHDLVIERLRSIWPKPIAAIDDAIVAATTKMRGARLGTFDRKLRNRARRLGIAIVNEP